MARARSALPRAGQRRAARGSGLRRCASAPRASAAREEEEDRGGAGREEEDRGGAVREEGRGRGGAELRPEVGGRRGAPMAGTGREQERSWPRRGEGAEQRPGRSRATGLRRPHGAGAEE
ncbi:hypothetical protein PVAP13_1NG067101 [Panicum virgatum]|uniref:Uncharacterized protein n=1 Tax=Panicum virgatum TaxID=38727 RepID=A0A8T0WNF3_PANVG|nr:hypothetical protein PVAP13_1NG067101 [Panicum virgatum]